MLKQAEKKKAVKYNLPETTAEQIVCGACNHVREENASNPEWQCPGCGAAYGKVNHKPVEKRYTQKELEEKNLEYLRKKQEGDVENQGLMDDTVARAGLTIGSVVLSHGVSRVVTSCAGLKTFVPANPLLLTAGALILSGTLLTLYTNI